VAFAAYQWGKPQLTLFWSGRMRRGPVSPADKPLKTPAREPQNERKGAIGPSEAGIELKYSPNQIKYQESFPNSIVLYLIFRESFEPKLCADTCSPRARPVQERVKGFSRSGLFWLWSSLPAAGRESGRALIGSERSHGRRSERSGVNILLPFTYQVLSEYFNIL